MVESELPEKDLIPRIRQFNRYYTGLLGLLRTRYLGGPVGYAEARIMFEIGNRPGCRAVELVQALGLDRGYLSRLLSALERKGLVRKSPSPVDRRSSLLHLTPAGEAAHKQLNNHSDEMVRSLITGLSSQERDELVAAMNRIMALLEGGEHKPG